MRIKDTRGNKSTTLTFVAVAFAGLLLKFVIGGLTLPYGLQ